MHLFFFFLWNTKRYINNWSAFPYLREITDTKKWEDIGLLKKNISLWRMYSAMAYIQMFQIKFQYNQKEKKLYVVIILIIEIKYPYLKVMGIINSKMCPELDCVWCATCPLWRRGIEQTFSENKLDTSEALLPWN